MSWPQHDVLPRPGPLEAGAIADGLLSDAGALFVRVPFLIPWPFLRGCQHQSVEAAYLRVREGTRGFGRCLRGLGVRVGSGCLRLR